jgi:hypothetical protein
MSKFIPTPTPLPKAPPPVPTSADPEVKAKKKSTKKAATNRMGYGRTDLTRTVGGSIGQPDTARKTLG